LAEVAEVTVRKLRQHGLSLPFSAAGSSPAVEVDYQI
jgi:hypothetical protein